MVKFLARYETEEEAVLFTPWSLVHVFSGAAAKDLGIPMMWFELLHGGYELKDQLTEPKENTLINSVGDQIAGTLGYLLSHKTKNKLFVWSYVLSWGAAVALGETIG